MSRLGLGEDTAIERSLDCEESGVVVENGPGVISDIGSERLPPVIIGNARFLASVPLVLRMYSTFPTGQMCSTKYGKQGIRWRPQLCEGSSKENCTRIKR